MLNRFVEFFIGKDIDTNIWRKNTIGGAGTFGMSDAEDEGYDLATTSASGSANIAIDGGDIRQFSNTSSKLIAIARRVSSSMYMGIGFVSTGQLFTILNGAYIDGDNNQANYRLITGDGSAITSGDTGIARDQSWHIFEVELLASSANGYIDGVLKVTNSTHLPSVNLQPIFNIAEFSTATVEGRIKYLEAFNKVSNGIYGSIYELFNRLTTVGKQWFIDWFNGASLNTNIWNVTTSFGTFTASMSDTEDEGLDLSSSTGGNQGGYMDFNNKCRQFIHNSSRIITVWRRVGSFSSYCGFWDSSSQNDVVYWRDAPTSDSFKTLVCGTAASPTATASSIAIDTSFHFYDIVLGASNVKAYIDGVLQITQSSNLPANKMQPFINTTTNTTPAAEVRIKYLEARNV